jgi:type II secretory pathway pseudopilin PulG
MEVDFNLQSERWPEGNGRGFCGAAGWMPVRLDHGFTLTGLAVVLACLSLIGFMLLPALIRAKDKQAIQVDLGNLRQLVQASQ